MSSSTLFIIQWSHTENGGFCNYPAPYLISNGKPHKKNGFPNDAYDIQEATYWSPTETIDTRRTIVKMYYF